MGIEWVFISFIKYIFIEGYSPSEDMIEGITAPAFIQLKKMLKQKSKTVREKLKETYTSDQIRLIEVVLKTEGAEYLVKSSAYVYENNADEKNIAKDIFDSFKQKYNQGKIGRAHV